MFDISIIIVNYKVKEYIIPCIESIYKHTSKSLRYEILVIDNNSNDGSIDAIKSQFSEVKVYENTENIGFSKAVNQGVKTAIGKYIFILNPDTELIEERKKKFIKAKHPKLSTLKQPQTVGKSY